MIIKPVLKRVKTMCMGLAVAVALCACGPSGSESVDLLPSGSAEVSSSLPQESSSVPQGSLPSPGASQSVGQSGSQPPTTFRLTIPEGYTLAKIGMTLEEMGVCTAAEFIEATQTGDFNSYALVAGQDYNENRCYKLEGYLFPDTYEFYQDVTPGEIIRTMLSHTEKKLDSALREEMAASGYSVDQIITLASIIEKEARGPGEMSNIASVFHNRLNVGMQLQSDVTRSYVINVIDPFVPNGGERYKYYYNTYRCAALPAGPICNPSMSAILAALRPSQTDYLYFLSDENDNFHYAVTFEEHEANVAQYL